MRRNSNDRTGLADEANPANLLGSGLIIKRSRPAGFALDGALAPSKPENFVVCWHLLTINCRGRYSEEEQCKKSRLKVFELFPGLKEVKQRLETAEL